MTHRHSEDIDPKRELDTQEMDRRIQSIAECLAIAFDRSHNELDTTYCSLMSLGFRVFLGTHRSIRALLERRKEDIVAVADAQSLVREQIERVFVISLLLEDPRRWTIAYFKDDWRRNYERFLLERDEMAALKRYRDFHDVIQPNSIETERVGLNITEKEREFVEWEFRKRRGDDVPRTISQDLKEPRESMKYFPTPGTAAGFVSEPGAKAFLGRWHREYGYYSGYTHGGFLKGLPAIIPDVGLTDEESEKVLETEYLSAIVVSYLAIASACSEAAHAKLEHSDRTLRPIIGLDGVEFLAELASLWDTLRESALLGRTLWMGDVRAVGTIVCIRSPTIGSGAA